MVLNKTSLWGLDRVVSEDTADVQVGIVRRTIQIAAATTKFKLIPNNPKRGSYFCNTCKKLFDWNRNSIGTGNSQGATPDHDPT